VLSKAAPEDQFRPVMETNKGEGCF